MAKGPRHRDRRRRDGRGAGAWADESTQQRINFLRTQIHILNKDLEPLRGERDDFALVLKRANEYRDSVRVQGQRDSMWATLSRMNEEKERLKRYPGRAPQHERDQQPLQLNREYAALYERYRTAMSERIRQDDHMRLMAIFDYDELVGSYGPGKPKRVRLEQLTKRITTLEGQLHQHEVQLRRLQ